MNDASPAEFGLGKATKRKVELGLSALIITAGTAFMARPAINFLSRFLSHDQPNLPPAAEISPVELPPLPESQPEKNIRATAQAAVGMEEFDRFDQIAREIVAKLPFENAPSLGGAKIIPWTEEEKGYVRADAYVGVFTFLRLGVEPQYLESTLPNINIVRINDGGWGFKYFGRVELGSPGQIIHEWTHELIELEWKGQPWQGMEESTARFAELEASHAFTPEIKTPKFKGCRLNSTGSFDYDAGAEAFRAAAAQFNQPDKPHLFAAMVNSNRNWVREDPANRLGHRMPAEELFTRLGKLYDKSPKEVERLLTSASAFQCVGY
ncbi:hypothetical protein M1403_00345 [Patescibacteria group bacterium]|nr:hypothetical protein [Patescibacteria group bacterium]